MRTVIRAGAVLAGAIFVSGVASAHVVLQKWEGFAGYQEYVTLVVPHGCGASPTTELRVKVPDGITIIVPEQKGGWQTRITKKKLPTPIRGEGGVQVSEVADEIIWSGGSLPSDQLGLFTMLARMPDDAAGKILYFRTVQKCQQGESRWIDTLQAGEPAWKIWALPSPSPFLEVRKAPGPQLGASMKDIAAERQRRGGKAPAQ
jgi:uncharacterized protein YcnI